MSLLLNTLANVTPVLAQAAETVTENAPAVQDIPFFDQKALIYAAAFTSIGFAARRDSRRLMNQTRSIVTM